MPKPGDDAGWLAIPLELREKVILPGAPYRRTQNAPRDSGSTRRSVDARERFRSLWDALSNLRREPTSASER
jgi:hypothetical protein